MNLLKYRKKHRKTQLQCANELGITVVYFSDIERGVFEPSKKLSKKIIKWSNGEITVKDLWRHFDLLY